VLTIAVGIGANTAISVVDAVAWRRMPVAEPERLLFVRGRQRKSLQETGFTYGQFKSMLDGSRGTADMAAFSSAAYAPCGRQVAKREGLQWFYSRPLGPRE